MAMSFDLNPQEQLTKKISHALVENLYKQAYIALFASIFCAIIVFIGLYSLPQSIVWFGIYLLALVVRIALVMAYNRHKNAYPNPRFWKNLYIVGSILGGASWGLAGILLLPIASPPQQVLLILMLAGVTGGAIPLASAIPGAPIGFLVFSILPFIISILFLRDNVYLLFDAALTLYLFYSIAVALKGHQLIKRSIELRFENDTLLNGLSVAKDELIEANQKLAHAATHDALTSVANYNLFYANFNKAIQRAQTHKKMFALLYIDLDRFKQVNDKYGHEIGNKLLIEITQRLREFFGDENIIARIGGDELTVILEDIVDRGDVKRIAEKTCQLISRPIRINDINLKLSASIGISMYPENGETLEGLLSHADKSMYYVKARGGNYFSNKSVLEKQS